MKKFKIEILYFAVLVLFTAYVALDTFVIPRRYKAVENVSANTGTEENGDVQGDPSGNGQEDAGSEAGNGQEGADPEEASKAVPPEDADYSVNGTAIKLADYDEYGTDIHVAEVWLGSVQQLRSAFAYATFGRNLKQNTSVIAKANNAVFAINGDFYGSRQNGYVIRNGELFRSTASAKQEDLVILKDGSFMIINESETTAEQLMDMGAWQLLSFGPGLIKDGKLAVSKGDEVDRAMASNPRTAIGIAEDGHLIFVVSDGRTRNSDGLSLYELGEFMLKLGAVTAYNLDGGGSSTMYFDGKIINVPTADGWRIKERQVSDIVYIGY